MFGRGGVGWILAFLGNPGPDYAKTRHNMGFLAGDRLAAELGVRIVQLRFRALTVRCRLEEEPVLMMKPQTYMNLSGESVGAAARFYKIPPERVLVVCDDIALPCGKLRVRRGGSAGGHNGLKNIIAHLGTDAFPRVRIGVGAPPAAGAAQIDWVTGVPGPQDAKLLDKALDQAAQAARDYILLGPDKTMGKYN